MGTMLGNKIGLAGEFRVMSELLLRGHNPAKSYLEEGPDIILENGYRIEVKSGHRCHCAAREKDRKKPRWRQNYLFTLRGGTRKQKQNLTKCDFIVLWCIDDDCFFILPITIFSSLAIGICGTSDNSKGKYIPYKNKWELLKIKE